MHWIGLREIDNKGPNPMQHCSANAAISRGHATVFYLGRGIMRPPQDKGTFFLLSPGMYYSCICAVKLDRTGPKEGHEKSGQKGNVWY